MVIAGEIVCDRAVVTPTTYTNCEDRPLPLERTPNRYTGASTATAAWDVAADQEVLR